MFHVGMNIQDKVKLIREVKRVYAATRFLPFTMSCESGSGELQYPLPWASNADESFVVTVDDYRQALVNGGSQSPRNVERKQFALDFFARMRPAQ